MRTELGCPGHCIVVRDCHFRRHTQTRHYRISTIGDYWIPGEKKRGTLGAGEKDYFESMVFALTDSPVPKNDGCICREVQSYCELNCRRYENAGDAQRGHEELVQEYEACEGSE